MKYVEQMRAECKREVSLVIDTSNPPQCVHIQADVPAINRFLNERVGRRVGNITITLAGSDSEQRRQHFADRNAIDWQTVMAELINEGHCTPGYSNNETGNVTLYVDDALVFQLFALLVFDPQHDSDPFFQHSLRKSSGMRDLRAEDTLWIGKLLQHELDHSAQTNLEGLLGRVGTRGKMRSLAFAAFGGLFFQSALAMPDVARMLTIAGLVTSYISVLAYVTSLFLKSDHPDYDNCPVERSARLASRQDQHLITLSPEDQAWFDAQKEEVLKAFTNMTFTAEPRPTLSVLRLRLLKLWKGNRFF